MSAFVTKMLGIFLAGLLALPVGFCCDTGATASNPASWSGDCCRGASERSPAPIKAAKSCCCQERAKAAEVARPGKKAPAAPFSVAHGLGHALRSSAVDAAWQPRTQAFFETAKHSWQAVSCVWLR